MNLYCNLAKLKRRLDITGTGEDTELTELLNAASRAVDGYTKRFFYALSGTHYYDGSPSPWFIPEDVLTVTTLKTDEDNDDTFENTYTATTDYYLYPLNSFPKTWAKINPTGSYGGFAAGFIRAIEIEGIFGYGDGTDATPYTDSGDDVADDPLSSSATTVTVAASTNFAVGQTILIESEQCYVSALATSTTLTVTRAVNGTTAASHVVTTDIYIYDYPHEIIEATAIQAMRWWKRRESAFQDMVGSVEVGQLIAYKGMDADLQLMIKPFIRRDL